MQKAYLDNQQFARTPKLIVVALVRQQLLDTYGGLSIVKFSALGFNSSIIIWIGNVTSNCPMHERA